MNQTKLISILFLVIFLNSCSTNKSKIFWVSGIKTECSAGAGKMQCLNVQKSEHFDNANWENFYDKIVGFEFEEGYLQKIEVKEIRLKDSKVPADGSSLKYELVKVLDKKEDTRNGLNGNWTLAKLNDSPINRMVVTPKMTIDLSKKIIFGHGGCNNYTGQIQSLSDSKITTGTIAGTKKACINKNVEFEFHQAINSISTYELNGENLTFYDERGKKILGFIKQQPKTANSKLHDIWAAIRIDGNPINRMSPTPRMEINLTKMKVMGNDGCNEYTGDIKEVTDNQITYGVLVSTKKMCRKMEMAESFNKAMKQVASYKLEGLNLILMDADNEEVLAFLKVD
tara:strand:+ start:201 stop:1223 length:1023 start_codon:yes stop_codon:yes gene_type:complete